MQQYEGTTILSVRRQGKVVIGGDGQVTLGPTVMKSNARKVRRLHRGNDLAGFYAQGAGAVFFGLLANHNLLVGDVGDGVIDLGTGNIVVE